MTHAYNRIIGASDEDRRGLFAEAATRIGTTVQNIEKDFWVCWVLDLLFNHLREGSPRFLFKGGTSLSKAYALISRFSEDIDVTVFRSDIGEEATAADLEQLDSRKKRDRRLDAIKAACQSYIDQQLRPELQATAKDLLASIGVDPAQLEIILDENDLERQTLLVRYPSVATGEPSYVRPSVKIESGAKSALDPNEPKIIVPYVAGILAADGKALEVANVRTIYPERTFLDKILILHGMNFYYEATALLRGDGRMSRHYYDVHQLMGSAVGKKACADDELITDCVRHAKMFFYRKNTGLDVASRGTFRLVPTASMLPDLRKDYGAMATMIFGQVPSFEAVLESVEQAERMLNKTK